MGDIADNVPSTKTKLNEDERGPVAFPLNDNRRGNSMQEMSQDEWR